jgi:hypothetical protein
MKGILITAKDRAVPIEDMGAYLLFFAGLTSPSS